MSGRVGMQWVFKSCPDYLSKVESRRTRCRHMNVVTFNQYMSTKGQLFTLDRGRWNTGLLSQDQVL